MPSLDDLKKPKAQPSFQKKPYRSWDLLDLGEDGAPRPAPEAAEQDPDAPENAPKSTAKGSDASARNRAQKGDQSGTTTGHNRAQSLDQSGTRKINRAQKGDQWGTTTGHNRAQARRSESEQLAAGLEDILADDPVPQSRHPVSKTAAKKSFPPPPNDINRAQKESVPDCLENCAPLKDDLCPVDGVINRAQSDLVPDLFANCAPLQSGTEQGVNRAQTSTQSGTNKGVNRAQKAAQKPLPSSRQLLAILEFMAGQQQSTGLAHTPRLKRSTVAMQLGISLSGIKNQLARLCAAGFLERGNACAGRGDAGTVYKVPDSVIKALQLVSNRAQKMVPIGHTESFNWAQENASIGHNNRAQQPGTKHSSSSSFINTTTTSETASDKDRFQVFLDAVARFGCADLLGGNDVMKIWREGAFANVEDLVESVENITAYVRSPDGKDLKKGWIIKTLQKGYYGRPQGFKSRAERDIEEAQQRLAARREQRLKLFEVEFEAWLAELDAKAREQVLKQHVQDLSFVPAKARQGILRNHFARAGNFIEFVTDDEDDR